MLAGNDTFFPEFESDFKLAETAVVNNSITSVSFAGLNAFTSQGYKHLQVRYLLKNSGGTSDLDFRFNGQTSATYNRKIIRGTGSLAQSQSGGDDTKVNFQEGQTASAGVGIFAVGIIDLVDFGNSQKTPVIRAIYGQNGSSVGDRIYMGSGLFPTAQAITSITISTFNGNFQAGSRLSLYGSKG